MTRPVRSADEDRDACLGHGAGDGARPTGSRLEDFLHVRGVPTAIADSGTCEVHDRVNAGEVVDSASLRIPGKFACRRCVAHDGENRVSCLAEGNGECGADEAARTCDGDTHGGKTLEATA